MKAQSIVKDILRGMGSSFGCGGFMVDADGRLIEEYVEDEDGTSEGMNRDGNEPQDNQDFCGADCIRSAAECSGA